mmetsp:Transcript_22349/g.69038  ORF Transcript_22349/g.69038 Transcript_22349/m.69038 type:complete len:491 (-) Transcript_22349:139-1611(-)
MSAGDMVEVEVGLEGPAGAPNAPVAPLLEVPPPGEAAKVSVQYLDTSWSFDVSEMSWSDLFFTSEGITVITLTSLLLLFLWRTLGPREVDESEEERKEMWRSHYERFGHPSEKRWKRRGSAAERLVTEDVLSVSSAGSPSLPESPVCPKTPPGVRYTRLSVGTNPGPTTVSVTGPRDSKLVILTCHDIASNFSMSFGELLNLPFSRPNEAGKAVLSAPRVYHVTVPGHQEGDDWCYGIKLDMEKLAAALHEVVERFEIQNFMGVGTGAGANVLLRYACAHPERVRGLALNQLTTSAATVDEQYFYSSTQAALALAGTNQVVASNVAGLLLLGTAPNNLRKKVLASLGRMNEANMRAYLVAFRCRDEIPAIRLEALNKSKIPVLLFTGPPQGAIAVNAAARFMNLCNRDAEVFAKLVPSARVVQVPLRCRLLSDLAVMHTIRKELDAFVLKLPAVPGERGSKRRHKHRLEEVLSASSSEDDFGDLGGTSRR